MVPSASLQTTTSSLPSPLTSPVSTNAGLFADRVVNRGCKLAVSLPQEHGNLAASKFAITRSSFPSPLRSPAATLLGAPEEPRSGRRGMSLAHLAGEPAGVRGSSPRTRGFAEIGWEWTGRKPFGKAQSTEREDNNEPQQKTARGETAVARHLDLPQSAGNRTRKVQVPLNCQ